MSRQEARETVLRLIFQIYIRENIDEKYIERMIDEYGVSADQVDYVHDVCRQVCDNVEFIDQLIEKAADNWKLTTMSKIDVAVMRLAIGEFYYVGVPVAVSINEAVNLAKKYGTEKSDKFVNGILGKVYKIIRESELGENITVSGSQS